jgi:hypothetical protein
MNDFIHQHKNVESSNQSEFYSIVGSEEFLDSNSNPRVSNENDTRVLAKKIIRDDGSVKFTIRTNATGKLQNPVSIYGSEKTNNFLDRVCRSSDKFKEVNMKTFDLYINFLKTKNIAWLNNAEREAE